MRYPKDRVAFYIDGFNLFHGALRGKPYRWLDLEAFCQHFVRPRQELVAVKYFTALVRNRADKPGQRERQKEYLRALATRPKVETYYGHFLKRKANRQLANPPKDGKENDLAFRSVWIEEEKGSDVNLASQFLSDGFRARYRRVRPGALRSSQLPLELEDEKGSIQCPEGWTSQK
jgi:hypothetical protein